MTPLGLSAWYLLPSLFVLGAVVGSFLNVCIYRIPRHESLRDQLRGLTGPPSSCPHCGQRIPLLDNIPVIGWLKLGGRCRFCSERISLRYPAIELINGLLFVVVYLFEIPLTWFPQPEASCLASEFLPSGGSGSAWLSTAAVMHYRYLYHMLLVEALVVVSFIDIDHRIIPDASTLPAMAVGVLGGGIVGQLYLVPVWFRDPRVMRDLQFIAPEWMHGFFSTTRVPEWIALHPHLHGLAVSLAGLLVGGGIVWAVRVIGYWILKQEAMGFGDVILMAMIGSFLGWQATVIVFFLAPVFALIVVAAFWMFRRHREIPYGPYLSLATLAVLLGWTHLWKIFDHLFGAGPLLVALAILLCAALVVTLQLVQAVKRLLGIQTVPEVHYEWVEQWTPADQLTYLAGERVDADQGRWKRDAWPGSASGRGLTFERTWRNGRGRR